MKQSMKQFDYNVQLTPELGAEIIRAVELGNHVETAAMVIGIPPKVLNLWLEKGSARRNAAEPYRSFALGVRNAWAKSERELVQSIRDAGVGVEGRTNRFGEIERDWRALAWLLERRDPKRWGMQIQVNVREELSQMLNKLEANLSPADYERVLAIITDDKGPATIDVTPGVLQLPEHGEDEQPRRKKEPPPDAH